jgi:hypothetical protein
MHKPVVSAALPGCGFAVGKAGVGMVSRHHAITRLAALHRAVCVCMHNTCFLEGRPLCAVPSVACCPATTCLLR